MAIPGKLKGKAGEFCIEDFTPTQWATAEEKAKIANKLTCFILSGFQQAIFTKAMYQRLSNMFGHIAHYDIHGFYATWFADIQCCRDWAEHITSSWLSGIGDPAFTWSDVEKALIQWAQEYQIAEQLDELYRREVEQKELALLDALRHKHAAPPLAQASLEPIRPPASQTTGHQLSLFRRPT